MESIMSDHGKYLQCFELLLKNSREHECMIEFIHTILPDVLASIGVDKPTLNVMGVGSGSGEIDLEILKVLHEMHPDAKVENEVVEPSKPMINKYKALLLKTPGLDYATFRWNKMTATEFKTEWDKRNEKKMHFITMIQMLCYVDDMESTLSFYQSLLHKDGKILVILARAESAWARLFYDFEDQLYQKGFGLNISTKEIKSYLDSKKITYQTYKLHSPLDVTECFTPGDIKGEEKLDLVTEVIDFSKTAPPELKDRVLEFLKHPDNSQEVNGRILFDCSLEAVLIDA
ncbi:histamine N-methyltransferase-like [Clarias gariepinus]|uniref:histamine N-methyltransferase-like n=1 Tax=Clarias gariepinus TaxID=13013 RepID=UPI00234C3F6E|nr:histamine N-methyltransferase-like [Clarias gariepinus]